MALLPKYTFREKEVIQYALDTIQNHLHETPIVIQGGHLLKFNKAVEIAIKERYPNAIVEGHCGRLKVIINP